MLPLVPSSGTSFFLVPRAAPAAVLTPMTLARSSGVRIPLAAVDRTRPRATRPPWTAPGSREGELVLLRNVEPQDGMEHVEGREYPRGLAQLPRGRPSTSRSNTRAR